MKIMKIFDHKAIRYALCLMYNICSAWFLYIRIIILYQPVNCELENYSPESQICEPYNISFHQ